MKLAKLEGVAISVLTVAAGVVVAGYLMKQFSTNQFVKDAQTGLHG